VLNPVNLCFGALALSGRFRKLEVSREILFGRRKVARLY
jgi:hypothetical protein